MKDLADIRVLTEAEGTVSVRVDKISSSSSSFFVCFFPPVLSNVCPVGRVVEGPQRLAGEALLLPILKILVRVPLPSPALAFLALAECDFWGPIVRKKWTTAFSAPRLRGEVAEAF